EDMAPGALFVFDYPDRDLGHAIFRVIERTISDPAVPEFTIRFERDVAYLFPDLGVGTGSGGGGAIQDHLEDRDPQPALVPQASSLRLIELPPALCIDGKIAIAPLVSRPNST